MSEAGLIAKRLRYANEDFKWQLYSGILDEEKEYKDHVKELSQILDDAATYLEKIGAECPGTSVQS